MDCGTSRQHYRPISKYLRIGNKEYAVLDTELSKQRALEHFSEALALLEKDQDDLYQQQIDATLTLATDFGCKDSPFIIALRILEPETSTGYESSQVAVFLKLAAERGHAEAAFRLASSYAAMSIFPEVEKAILDYLTHFSDQERSRLAEHYFTKAVELGHQRAIEELIIAYAYGRGYMEQSAEGFIHVCEQQVAGNNQAVMIGYGAWLAGMTVEGEAPLAEAIQIPLNSRRGLSLLLRASQQSNLQLAQHALHLICSGVTRNCWGNSDRVCRQLIKNAMQGNQLLALYLAWYSIPSDQRAQMPAVLDNYQLVQLAEIVPESVEEAVAYLDSAFFGKDEDIAGCAREILSHVFGRCFMDEEGMLVWQ